MDPGCTSMKLLVVNCNTSQTTSAAIGAVARAAASPGTEVEVTEPSWGVASAEGYYESYISAAAVLDVCVARGGEADAVVLAGFGEHGREGVRQLLTAPVVDITEAAAMAAMLLGRRYGVVTTMGSSVAGIEDSLLTAGLHTRCAGVRAAGVPVLALHDDVVGIARRLAVEARALAAAGADVIVLGCAGMAGLDAALESLVDMPVVDGVQAAVALAEGLVRMGKRTSKTGPFAPPSPLKDRPGWPVSAPARHSPQLTGGHRAES